jgi:hypothetical protein
LISEKTVKLGDSPGREIHIETPTAGTYRARLYLVERRLYQVVVLAPKEVATSEASDWFLESFQLTK